MHYTPHITLNGYQLRDALNLIAPDGTPEQLRMRLCIQPGPARVAADRVEPAGNFCWQEQNPGAGSIRLDEEPRADQPEHLHDAQIVAIANKLIEAARWVYSNADARRQPEARALARIVLRTVAPVINTHVDHLCNTHTPGANP